MRDIRDGIVLNRVDIELLTEQRNFLLEYPWRDEFPPEADGLINLCEHILDQAEGILPHNQTEPKES